MSNEFEFEVDGRKVYTGMKMPEVKPIFTSFTPHPRPARLSLDRIAKLVSNPNIVPVRQAYANEVDWFNQGRRSSCNAYAMGWGMSVLNWRHTGKKVRLSPEWTYAKINGGKDQGSHLDDGMKEGWDFGMPAYDQRLYEQFNMRSIQKNMELGRWAAESCNDHKYAVCYQAATDTFENMMMDLYSCVASGGIVILAVHVGANYQKSRDIAGFDDGPGNHAIGATDIVLKTPKPQSIEDLLLDSPQTWSKRFGVNGFTKIGSKLLHKPGQYHAMYCVNAVTAERDQLPDCRA